MIYIKNNYVIEYKPEEKLIYLYNKNEILLYKFNPDSKINTLLKEDSCTDVELIKFDEHELVFNIKSEIWKTKKVRFILKDDFVEYTVEVTTTHEQRIDTVEYLHSTNGCGNGSIESIYVPRFDWMKSKVFISPTETDSLGCQQWLSPPPFCYGLKLGNEFISCGIGAFKGEQNFISFDYNGSTEGGYYSLNYEGHTKVNDQFKSPALVFGFGQSEANSCIQHYVDYLRITDYLPQLQEKTIPDWWSEPIFCGWGEMRYDYRRDHDGLENGTFINVTSYATEATYRHYDAVMEAKGVNPGTVIIDMGWAKDPALGEPCPRRWVDMRKFIDEQHDKGRKVLLWYTPVVTKGLPVEACMTLEGKPVAPDPTNPLYKKILDKQLYKMLSADDDCLNADGFKIDFTQNTPSEDGLFRNYTSNFWGLIQDDNGEDNKYIYPQLKNRQAMIKTYGDSWGVELLKGYIELIYTGMKKIDEESVLITHTANPYFADVVDILRLNDLDGECDNVLGVMQNRYEISKMCNPQWLIDTDNDLMYDKRKWLDYIQLQPLLGIPDTYYLTGIATSMEELNDSDYECLKTVWADYRKQKNLI